MGAMADDHLHRAGNSALINYGDSHINTIVMDYLVREGYPKAAQKFALEANIRSDANLDSIQERVEIRKLIYAGEVQTAIDKINELNPQVRAFPSSPNSLP